MRILIVDDDRTMRFTIQHALQSIGCDQDNISHVGDGDEALKTIDNAFETQKPYHVVLLDWHMPNKSGLEVLQECSQKPYFNNTAFVMLTGEVNADNVKQAIDLGAMSYITKPVSSVGLTKHMERIANLLQKKNKT